VQPVAPPARVWPKIEQRLAFRKPFVLEALGLVASGAAAALIAVAVLCRSASSRSYIAVLSDPKTSHAVLIATAERGDTALHVTTLDPAIHVAGRSLELWALPRGGQPRSLGLVAGQKAMLKLAAAADQSLGDVPALAVSLEPRAARPPVSRPARCSTPGLV
jgi:anti-sigma-K factor RskA